MQLNNRHGFTQWNKTRNNFSARIQMLFHGVNEFTRIELVKICVISVSSLMNLWKLVQPVPLGFVSDTNYTNLHE